MIAYTVLTRFYGFIYLIIWIPYAYSFFPLSSVGEYPILAGYHLIMLIIAITGTSLLLKNKLIGFRFLFFATLMYVFYLVLDHIMASDSLFGALDNPSGNLIIDDIKMQYQVLKTLPLSDIQLHRKIIFYYQWGVMPVIQLLSLFVLPLFIYKYHKIPYNNSLKLGTPQSGAP